jgi:GT2 family glycosyltransferase
MIDSIKAGTVQPDGFYIIDNGGTFVNNYLNDVTVYTPGYNLGCAQSWNWFIKNIPEPRLICNDDLVFMPDTLEKFIAGYSKTYITCPDGLADNMFSCFSIPDILVKEVGYFDERISPNYAYFEDNDYYRRMLLLDISPVVLVKDCKVEHPNSSTLHAFNKFETEMHHKRFRIAQANYIAKWGGLPGVETFTTPFNK